MLGRSIDDWVGISCMDNDILGEHAIVSNSDYMVRSAENRRIIVDSGVCSDGNRGIGTAYDFRVDDDAAISDCQIAVVLGVERYFSME